MPALETVRRVFPTTSERSICGSWDCRAWSRTIRPGSVMPAVREIRIATACRPKGTTTSPVAGQVRNASCSSADANDLPRRSDRLDAGDSCSGRAVLERVRAAGVCRDVAPEV